MKKRSRHDKAEIVIPRLVDDQYAMHKPIGLWYSVDGDWERWCKSEALDWLDGLFEHEVALGGEHIKTIQDVQGLDSFHETYKKGGESWRSAYIDWRKVSKDYDGIEIAPYLWERRLHGPPHLWYYGWDCASGCIWRPKGVKLTRLVPGIKA